MTYFKYSACTVSFLIFKMASCWAIGICMILLQVKRTIGIKAGCEQLIPRDCQDIQDSGFTQSGVYNINPVGTYYSFEVYCDLEMDDGGWLVIQSRKDGSVGFLRNWTDYEVGFGNVYGEHWLGNLKTHMISSQGFYELRVDLADFEGNATFARFDYFKLTGPEDMYRITVAAYTGNAGDSLSYHSGSPFSTVDRDNDNSTDHNCALRFDGGWWYSSCHTANLNGLYKEGYFTSTADGVTWGAWRGSQYSLKTTEMKIRRT